MAERISTTVGDVMDSLLGVAKKEISYMWNCKEYVEKFKREIKSLEVMKSQVQQQIAIAEAKGDSLLPGVEEWRNEADDEISKAKELLAEFLNSMKTCFIIRMCGNCPNLHHYGKMISTKMTPSLWEHQNRGKDFVTCVSVETRGPGPLDVYQKKDLDDLHTHTAIVGDIIKSLEDDSIQITGIYGLGDVGKTTLAKEAVIRVKNTLFAHVTFTTVSQTVVSKEIKKDIKEAKKRIMKGEKVLIILDDVWEKLDLEELCIPCGENYMNCKILLTSRGQKVLLKMNARSIIYVDTLPTKEAWILFRRVVGERLETDANLKSVAEEVAKECGGLPLLIQAVGYALKDKSIHSWKAVLSQLKKPVASQMDPDIEKAFNRLRLSYEYLESEETKWCFLLCGLFNGAEDIELEDLVRYVVGLKLFDKLDSIEDARRRVRYAVNILTSSCLLLKVEYDKGCTKMHNVLRFVALSIGYDQKDKYKCLSKAGKDLIEWLPRDNNVKDLTDYMKTNFDDFPGSYNLMINLLDKKAPLRAVLKATNHYDDRNIIKDGGSGKVYKGKLKWNGRLMYVAVWRLDGQYRKRELAYLSAFKHDNISSIHKYFDEDDESIIIYEHASNGILQGHLSNPALTWSRRLQICLDVARALNYMHDQGLIHCDINSSKILLDEDWKPRIFGFELCTKYPQSWTDRLHLSRYLGTTNVITPKYDVYLFGVMLSEVLCGKKHMFDEHGFIGKLGDNIDHSLEKHIGSQSMKFTIIIAYNCLDKNLVFRPSMNQIVKDLEEALELQRKEEKLVRPF
uniref:disease resistance protein At4g27190-like n=1 Tax=Erigeron canadensis TaxID=72917 RepID=UPI001CB994D2|nr:disease resistance protein At4g27190-like [Erigeron canadensis]